MFTIDATTSYTQTSTVRTAQRITSRKNVENITTHMVVCFVLLQYQWSLQALCILPIRHTHWEC